MRKQITIGSVFIAAIAIVMATLSRSSGQPAATQPSAVISPEARQILNQMRDAYGSLNSLAVSGTIDGQFDIDGVQRTDTGNFSGLYSAQGLFRSEMNQIHSPDPASTQPTTSDAVLGNTGQHVYFFLPPRNRYILADTPTGKLDLDALGSDLADVLRNQDLSLALAMSGDASNEISQLASSISRVEDQKIDGQPLASIAVVYPRYDVTLSIDPKTHLLRRAVADLSKNARLLGAQSVKTAVLTMNYTNVPGVKTDAAAFAWSPPAGAQMLSAGGEGPASDQDGKPAPSFSLTGVDGKTVTSQSLAGSVYVLDFWATWCGPCMASLPHVDAIYNNYKSHGVKFFGVDLQEDKDTIQKFINDSKLSIPVLMDTDGKLLEQYEPAGGIPFSAIVGRDGKVIKAGFFGGAEDEMRPILDAALKK